MNFATSASIIFKFRYFLIIFSKKITIEIKIMIGLKKKKPTNTLEILKDLHPSCKSFECHALFLFGLECMGYVIF